jgi:flavin prenyltransferase
MQMKRLIAAITGASGAICGVRALEALHATGEIEVRLVISLSAVRTRQEETDFTMERVRGQSSSSMGPTRLSGGNAGRPAL